MKMGSHFFQIIHDYVIKDRRLELPKKFVKMFGEALGKAGLIEDPTGKIWPVELRKAKGEVYFQSGWQEFMEYFSIGVGHVLVFRYEGDSHFHVIICDVTACEIDYPCQTKDIYESSAEENVHSQDLNPHTPAASKRRFEDYQDAGGSVKRNKSDGSRENKSKPRTYNFMRHPEVVTISSDGESQNEDENPGDSAEQRCQPQASNFVHEPEEVTSASRRGKCKIPKKANCAARKVCVSERRFQRVMSVIEEARAYKSEFPLCTIIIKPSHLHQNSLVHVPSEFTRDFLPEAGNNFVTLKDSRGRKWYIGYYIRRVGKSSFFQANLYKGWYEFVLDNHLKVDDACVFELVDKDKLEMKVNIIRVCQDTAVNTISSDSESEDGRCNMPAQPSHEENHKIPKPDASERKFQKAMGVAKEARAFKSEFPTCTIIMKPSYLPKGRCVHVPFEFARDFLTNKSDNCVTLKDSAGKKWYVRYKTSSGNKASLYKGWYQFVLDNHLKVDDACVFELVDIDNLEMKVNIIRASPDVV